MKPRGLLFASHRVLPTFGGLSDAFPRRTCVVDQIKGYEFHYGSHAWVSRTKCSVDLVGLKLVMWRKWQFETCSPKWRLSHFAKFASCYLTRTCDSFEQIALYGGQFWVNLITALIFGVRHFFFPIPAVDSISVTVQLNAAGLTPLRLSLLFDQNCHSCLSRYRGSTVAVSRLHFSVPHWRRPVLQQVRLFQ